MSSKKDLTEPVSPPRRSPDRDIVNPSPTKKPKLGSPSTASESSSSSIAAYTPKLKIVENTPAEPVRSAHHIRESITKPVIAALKPLHAPPTADTNSTSQNEESKGPSVRDMELARWTPYAMASVPKRVPVSNADDAIIRRKLMFEAGNPPASSHRGIKLLMGSVGHFTTAVREQRHFEEIEPLFQRIQLFLRQEELTLTRLRACGESMRKNAEADARFPDEVAAAIEDVKNQISNQQKKLEQASKTETRFKEYLDMANSIRKLPSYEDLLKSRDDLREETSRLKEEKESLDRQQADKYPFLIIANWALNNVRFEGKKLDPSKAKIRLVTASVSKEHSRRDPVRHRKSPKKSSKETRNSEK